MTGLGCEDRSAGTCAIGRPIELRAPWEEVAAIEAALEGCAIARHSTTSEQVTKLKSCLHEEFLLGLREPSANHYWPPHPDRSSWRYLFRRQCFRILGVHEGIPEGHADGLPPLVNTFIRTKWWPSKNEDKREGNVGPLRGRGHTEGNNDGHQGPGSAPYPIRGRRWRQHTKRGGIGAATHPDAAGEGNSP